MKRLFVSSLIVIGAPYNKIIMKSMLKALVAGLIASETSALYVENSSTDARSQTFSVPIDEKRALSLTVSPNYDLDAVNSVTLKAFRKIVGYDTFESIRKKDRNEVKDSSDYYNVTVSMMIQRKPVALSPAPKRDPYNPSGAASLSATLDKGFPYDD